MTNRRPRLQEDIHLVIMRRLEEVPDISQRQLAKELGVSLGSINYCLRALMDKGWIKIQNFSQSSHKLGYIYFLTPAGIAEKSLMTAKFLKSKLDEYEALRMEIESLKQEVLKKQNEYGVR